MLYFSMYLVTTKDLCSLYFYDLLKYMYQVEIQYKESIILEWNINMISRGTVPLALIRLNNLTCLFSFQWMVRSRERLFNAHCWVCWCRVSNILQYLLDWTFTKRKEVSSLSSLNNFTCNNKNKGNLKLKKKLLANNLKIHILVSVELCAIIINKFLC